MIPFSEFTAGTYKLYFDTKSYFDGLGMETFYPYVEVVFQVKNPQEHHHISVLISAYGYSTYRGIWFIKPIAFELNDENKLP